MKKLKFSFNRPAILVFINLIYFKWIYENISFDRNSNNMNLQKNSKIKIKNYSIQNLFQSFSLTEQLKNCSVGQFK